MIKYFIRHYWRYLAMALAFATISFFINSCQVNAENEIYTQTINYNDRVNTRENNIFTNNNGVLNDGGRGTLIFNVATVEKSTNTSFFTPTIQEITINTGTDIYICNIGSTSTTYYEEENYKGNVYTAVCEINIGNMGIRQIKVKMNDTPTNYFWLKSSQYMTFIKNTEIGTQNILSAIQNMLNAYLGNINVSTATSATNTGTTNAYLQSIQNLINTDLTNIINLIIQQNGKLDNINDKLNDIINNNQVCNYYDKISGKYDNKYINSAGNLDNNNNFIASDFIKISKNAKITLLKRSNQGDYICFYNINKTKIQCYMNSSLTEGQTINIPNNSSYIRVSFAKALNIPILQICDTSQNMQNNQNEQIIQGQNDINNNITDPSTDDPSGDISDMNQNEISNSVISDLLLLPINMFQNILNAVNGSCSSFSLGALFGTNLVLPCINLESLLGSTLWGVIDVLFCGIFVLSMRKKFVDIFQNITSLKDRGNELE